MCLHLSTAEAGLTQDAGEAGPTQDTGEAGLTQDAAEASAATFDAPIAGVVLGEAGALHQVVEALLAHHSLHVWRQLLPQLPATSSLDLITH